MKCWYAVIKLPLMCWVIFVIALQMLLVKPGAAQTFQLEAKMKRGAVNFLLVKNLIIVPVYINGNGPYNFILDTGVDPMIITDTTIINKADIQGLRRIRVNGTGEGDEIEAYYSNNIACKIGNAYTANMPSVILKEDVFNLSRYLGMKVHGLIGYYFFNSFIVKVNYMNAKVNFKKPELRKKSKWNRINLEFLENKPYINTEITLPDLGKINAKLIVDCGASHALSLESLNGEVFPLPDPSFHANLGIGLSGKISGSIGRVSTFKLGPYTMKKVLTSFPNYNDVAAKSKQKDRTGNLGADILKRFNIVYDYQDAAMYVKKNSLYRIPFEHDMSGMEIYNDDKGFNRVFISRIEPASPAEKAGILADDEILSINFVKASNYSLDDVTGIFKSQNDRTLLIEVARGKKILVKLVTLKRRL